MFKVVTANDKSTQNALSNIAKSGGYIDNIHVNAVFKSLAFNRHLRRHNGTQIENLSATAFIDTRPIGVDNPMTSVHPQVFAEICVMSKMKLNGKTRKRRHILLRKPEKFSTNCASRLANRQANLLACPNADIGGSPTNPAKPWQTQSPVILLAVENTVRSLYRVKQLSYIYTRHVYLSRRLYYRRRRLHRTRWF